MCILPVTVFPKELSPLLSDKYGLAVLESSMGDPTVPSTFVGAIDSLYEIKRNSDQRCKIYVELLDYYLGSGPDTVLHKLIIKEGKAILPELKRKLKSSLNCLPEFKKICEKDKKNRDKIIVELINEIEKSDLPSTKKEKKN